MSSNLETKEEHRRHVKEECKRQVYAVVEILDDLIPVVGKFMDIPFIDRVEKQIVDNTIDAIWDMCQKPCVIQSVDLKKDDDVVIFSA
jgi:hypothetical protein